MRFTVYTYTYATRIAKNQAISTIICPTYIAVFTCAAFILSAETNAHHSSQNGTAVRIRTQTKRDTTSRAIRYTTAALKMVVNERFELSLPVSKTGVLSVTPIGRGPRGQIRTAIITFVELCPLPLDDSWI